MMRLDASDPGNGIFEDLCFNFCKVFSAGIFWWVRHCINPTKCFESSWCWRKALYNINVLIIIISVKKSYVPLPNKLKGLVVVDFLLSCFNLGESVGSLYLYLCCPLLFCNRIVYNILLKYTLIGSIGTFHSGILHLLQQQP